MDMQKKVLGHSYSDWAWVVGGGVVAGILGKMVGIKGMGLSVMGSITGYCLRGWKNGGDVKKKIIDLRQKAMQQVQMAASNGANGIPILEETANQFIVPDPSAAPAPGSEGALAGGYGMHAGQQYGLHINPRSVVHNGVVTQEVWQPGVINQTPLRTR